MNIYGIVFVIFSLLELYLIIRALREWYFEATLSQFGKQVEARISDQERKIGRFRDPDSYFVRFRFNSDDTSYEIRQRISWRNFLRLYPGAFVIVNYLPEHPEIARLAEKDFDNTQRNSFT